MPLRWPRRALPYCRSINDEWGRAARSLHDAGTWDHKWGLILDIYEADGLNFPPIKKAASSLKRCWNSSKERGKSVIVATEGGLCS
jgi:hypothetical protein